jgi:hypothetical protein
VLVGDAEFSGWRLDVPTKFLDNKNIISKFLLSFEDLKSEISLSVSAIGVLAEIAAFLRILIKVPLVTFNAKLCSLCSPSLLFFRHIINISNLSL